MQKLFQAMYKDDVSILSPLERGKVDDLMKQTLIISLYFLGSFAVHIQVIWYDTYVHLNWPLHGEKSPAVILF